MDDTNIFLRTTTDVAFLFPLQLSRMMQELNSGVREVGGKLEETKIADQLQDAALTDVTQGW